MIEPVDHGAIGALRREGADMGFDQHGFLPWPSAPIPRAPLIGAVIDHFARAGDVLRLKCRGRIRNIDLVVDPEFVERAGLDAGDISGKPAVIAAAQGMRLVEQHIDALRRRRPQPERRAIRCELYAELPPIHAEPAKARTERGGASASARGGEACSGLLAVRRVEHLLPILVFGHLRQFERDGFGCCVQHDEDRRLSLLGRAEHIGEKPAFRKIPVLLASSHRPTGSATARRMSRPRGGRRASAASGFAETAAAGRSYGR